MRKDSSDYINYVTDEYVFFFKRDFGQNPPAQAVSSFADAAKAIMTGRKFGADSATKNALEKSLKDNMKAVGYDSLKIGECLSCLAYYCVATEEGSTVTDPACYWADDICMRILGPYLPRDLF